MSSTLDRITEVEHHSLNYYLELKYLVAVYPEDQGFTVMIPELPGCMSQGKTFDEAMLNIDKAKCLWLTTVYAQDRASIPLPSNHSQPAN
ncbi:MAG: type II toxin-antitoxin system HicB family antitoxin [Cyanobacteria bacterium J06600_6]